MATNVTAISQFVRGLTKGRPLGVISVAEFGAAGSGTVNERTQIQNAIDAANAQGGGVVYFPPGRYRIDSSLTLQQGVWLVGASRWPNSSQLVSSQPILMLNGILPCPPPPPPVCFSEFDMGIAHLFIDGGGAATGGVELDRIAGVYIIDCTFTRFNGTGVAFKDCQWSEVANCRFSSSVVGVSLDQVSTGPPNGNVIRGCRFESNSLRGIDVTGTTGTGIELLRIESCYFVNNGTVGDGTSAAIRTTLARALTITGCWFELTGGWASIRLLDGTIAPSIQNNFFGETTGRLGGGMIYADPGTQVPVIANNHFEGTETRYVTVVGPGTKEPALAYIAQNSFGATNPTLTDDSHLTTANPPSVTNADYLALNHSPGTTITNLNNGSPGQRVTLLFLQNNITIPNGTAFKLAGATNFTGGINDTLTLIRYGPAVGSAWYEVGRSNN